MVFANAPHARHQLEAMNSFDDPFPCREQDPDDEDTEEVLVSQSSPKWIDIVDRKVCVQKNGLIRKSVRKIPELREPRIAAEKRILDLVAAETTVPVLQARGYTETEEFEHLFTEQLPGEPLLDAPDVSAADEAAILDQVVDHLAQLRALTSPTIKAAHVDEKYLPAGLGDALAFTTHRIKGLATHEAVTSYVATRCAALAGAPNVLTHGNLSSDMVIVRGSRVTALVDFEEAGFFPPYWEWLRTVTLLPLDPDDRLVARLAERLRREGGPAWDGMREVEELVLALEMHARPDRDPDVRDGNRKRGWARVCAIVGADLGPVPEVDYGEATKDPVWMEYKGAKVKK